MDDHTWEVAATLLRRTIDAAYNTYDGRATISWQGGGYDWESIDARPEEVALMDTLRERPWCHECERFLRPGESMWKVEGQSGTYCDTHWAEYRERAESMGRTVIEADED